VGFGRFGGLIIVSTSHCHIVLPMLCCKSFE
jgi:hypothetical protein